MVDENMERKDISFGEMANLVRRYAEDLTNDCNSVSNAVAVHYKSANYTKRGYIRAFAELLARLEKVLEFPYDIPRNVGVELERLLESNPALQAKVVAALRAEPDRDAEREVAILREFTDGVGTLPVGKVPEEKQATRYRQAKTTFQVSLAQGVARCSASQGRLEMRQDRDFSTVDLLKLERAVMAFFEALND
jgi:ParB family chromosome partitioning protein